MDSRYFNNLVRRHGFESWLGRNRLPENLSAWRYFLHEGSLSSWRPYRNQQIEAPRVPVLPQAATRAGLTQPRWLRAVQSVWTPVEGTGEAILNIDVYECASRVAAHEFLVRMLGEFESPLVAHQEQIDIGDVVFTGPANSAILFARANLVFLVRNGGRNLVSVDDPAGQLDRDLISKPGAEPGRVETRVLRFEADERELKRGREVDIPIEIEEGLTAEIPPMYKFFSPTGEVVLEEGRPVYRSVSPGSQEIDMYAINPSGGETRQELPVTAK
jgi:hypothetical protein